MVLAVAGWSRPVHFSVVQNWCLYGAICRPLHCSRDGIHIAMYVCCMAPVRFSGGDMVPSAAEISIEQVSSFSSKCTMRV